MLCRTIRRSKLDTKLSTTVLPPAFLLPIRARYFNSTAQQIDQPPNTVDASQTTLGVSQSNLESSPIPSKNAKRSPPQAPPAPSAPLVLSETIKQLLPALSAQQSHYLTLHVHGKPYLVTAGDSIRLPFRMPGVVPGDILRMNRVTVLGSRDYTLKGSPYVDERLFECRATVMGVESEPMRIKEKKKRRNRRTKTVKSKHKYTILRVSEVNVKRLDELEG